MPSLKINSISSAVACLISDEIDVDKVNFDLIRKSTNYLNTLTPSELYGYLDSHHRVALRLACSDFAPAKRYILMQLAYSEAHEMPVAKASDVSPVRTVALMKVITDYKKARKLPWSTSTNMKSAMQLILNSDEPLLTDETRTKLNKIAWKTGPGRYNSHHAQSTIKRHLDPRDYFLNVILDKLCRKERYKNALTEFIQASVRYRAVDLEFYPHNFGRVIEFCIDALNTCESKSQRLFVLRSYALAMQKINAAIDESVFALACIKPRELESWCAELLQMDEIMPGIEDVIVKVVRNNKSDINSSYARVLLDEMSDRGTPEQSLILVSKLRHLSEEGFNHNVQQFYEYCLIIELGGASEVFNKDRLMCKTPEKTWTLTKMHEPSEVARFELNLKFNIMLIGANVPCLYLSGWFKCMAGIHQKDALQCMSHVIDTFKKENTATSEAINKIFSRTEQSLKHSAAYIKENLRKYRYYVFQNCGWKGHAVHLGLMQDKDDNFYLIYGNRGSGSEPRPGLHFYKIGNVDAFKSTSALESVLSEISKENRSFLDLHSKDAGLAKALGLSTAVFKAPMSPQKIGSCVLAAVHMSLLTGLIVDAFSHIDEVGKSISERLNMAYKAALPLYKEWRQFSRINGMKSIMTDLIPEAKEKEYMDDGEISALVRHLKIHIDTKRFRSDDSRSRFICKLFEPVAAYSSKSLGAIEYKPSEPSVHSGRSSLPAPP